MFILRADKTALKMNAFAFLIFRKEGNPMKLEGQVRIPSGCAISAVISKEGNRMSGEMITNSMKPMHDRSNGLGGGFAGYGIYPEYKDYYALHMFFDSRATRKDCETFLKERFEIIQSEIIPTRKIPSITNEPIIWRYFVAPLKSVLTSMQLDEKEFVARTVMKINTELSGAYVFSSGKNMGTFKAVGRIFLDRTWPISYQYSRLVGRCSSIHYTRLFCCT